MIRVDRKRLEALSGIGALAAVLANDLSIAFKRYEQEALRFTPGESPFEVSYWGKTAARTFLSFIDGICFAMRKATVDFARDLGVELTEKERLRLQEQKRGKDGNIVPANLSPLDSVKLAFRHFPRLFGVDYTLDAGVEHWRALDALAKARNKITHPETLDDLTGKGISGFWIPSYSWFRGRLIELFSRCSEAVPQQKSILEVPSVDAYKFPGHMPALFSDADYAKFRSSLLKSLDYTGEAFKILRNDTLRSMKFASDLAKIDSLIGPCGQFGLRNWVRTFISEVEGTASFAVSFIQSAADLGEAALTEEDCEILAGKGFETGEHVVRVMTIWSRELGDCKSAQARGANWRAFCEIANLRDKLTHPRSEKTLFIGIEKMKTLIAADEWFRSVTALDHVRPEKLGL